MPVEVDVKDPAESSAADEDENKDESLKTSEVDTETSEGEESGKKPLSKAAKRIQQLIDQNKELVEVAKTLRTHAISPEDRAKFDAWKKAELKAAEEAEDAGEISPAKLKALRKLMREADPEYAQLLKDNRERNERETAEKQDRVDAQFDAAEEKVREYAATVVGIPKKNERATAQFARNVMEAVQDDPKLLRQWNTGNLDCVRKACEIVKKDYIDVVRSNVAATGKLAGEKRLISRLPSLPSGSASTGASGNAAGGKGEEKGITKKTHEDAWAYMQQLMQD